jgi:molecular chaperone GrpE
MDNDTKRTEREEPPITASDGQQTPPSASGDSGSDSEKVLALKEEVATLHDRWMRAEADTANVRARAKRDIEDAKQYAVQKFATDVVEAAENLRRGLESIPFTPHAEPEIVTRLRDGFIGVERSFIDLLKRNGIEKEDPTGAPFNSERHQAISEQASSRPPGTVLHAATAAWTLHGRLLRPAMVIVAKPQETEINWASPQR